jgi:hypothetical protein
VVSFTSLHLVSSPTFHLQQSQRTHTGEVNMATCVFEQHKEDKRLYGVDGRFGEWTCENLVWDLKKVHDDIRKVKEHHERRSGDDDIG